MNYETILLFIKIVLISNVGHIIYYFGKFTKYMFSIEDKTYNKKTEKARLYFHIIALPWILIAVVIFKPTNLINMQMTDIVRLPIAIGFAIIGFGTVIISWLDNFETHTIKFIERNLEPDYLTLKENINKEDTTNKWIENKLITNSSKDDCLKFLNQMKPSSKINIVAKHSTGDYTYTPLFDELDKIYINGIYLLEDDNKRKKIKKELFNILTSNFTLNKANITKSRIESSFNTRVRTLKKANNS